MESLIGFSSWREVLDYAAAGGPLYYKAPMTRNPVRFTPGKNQVGTYETRARSIKMWPSGSVGRGNARTADPFTADSGHLGRFSKPDAATHEAHEEHRLIGPGTDGMYKYRGASIEMSGFGRTWHATVRFQHQEKDFDGKTSDEALEKAKAWIDAAPEHGTMEAHRDPPDETAATELVMYIENTSDLSPDGPSGQGRSVLLNALRKWRKGTYDPKMAVKLFGYLAEAGAKRYAKEMGSSPKDWSTMFNPATRHEAARQLEASFRNSAERGEYDHVDTKIGAHEADEETNEGPQIRLYKVIAQGNVMTHLGRTTFSKTQAEDMANDLRRRGYADAHIEPWAPKDLSEEAALEAPRGRNIQVGDKVRFTKKFLQNTGQYTGHEANGRWEVLEIRGSYAFVNQPSDTSYFTPAELQADPMLKWRAINVGNLETA